MPSRLESVLRSLQERLLAPTAPWANRDPERAELAQALKLIAAELSELRAAENARAAERASAQSEAETKKAAFDRFYLEFENRYRGSEAEVKEKCRFYLSRLPEGDPSEASLLDLGCGRGEWLELLAEAGYSDAQGIDCSPAMVEHCCRKGLKATQRDALKALDEVAPNSLAAITAFHLVEHLAFRDVLALLAASCQALRPGGRLILETPNPRNFVVGSNTFHFDPTHQKPLPIELLSFACQQVGLQIFAIEQRHPHPDLLRVADALPADASLFTNALIAGLDYGLIAEKPA